MMKEILEIKTVNDCGKCLGCRAEHPLACVFSLENPGIGKIPVKFDFFVVMLIEDCSEGCCCCGRKYYDFSDASMVFLRPGELFRMTSGSTLPGRGTILAFHPELLYRTTLGRHIGDYTFFGYRKEEALHLSMQEKMTVTKCLKNIEEEVCHTVDRHSSTLISRHIELLLDYCSRFYERQFITREEKNKKMIGLLDRMLDTAIDSGRAALLDLPSAGECAQSLGLSEAYFKDLLKFETGKTYDEYCMAKRLEQAKEMLLHTDLSPEDVASHLGFRDIRQFSFIFRRLTGCAPEKYRISRN